MGQADQQGNTAAPSVPVQWSEGQLVLTPADWRISQQNSVAAESLPTKWSAGQMSLSPADCVIAVRLMDWAVDFMCNFHPRCTISGGSSTTLPSDIELARLTVRLAEVLEVVYSRSKPSIELVRGSADYNIEDSIRQWANGDCESDPGYAWIAANCSSRPPARLADIMMAMLGMPDYRADQHAACVRTKGLTRVLAAVMASHLRQCTVWARDNG
jgi:hypothetical protein